MTIVSNIHVGLAGWSNATYGIGTRRNNSGNAYVCSTAGTSTAPPTGTGTNIAPGGTAKWDYISAVDFSDLQSWASAIPATLTQPVVGLLWNDGVITATATTTILTLAGNTTSSVNTITLMPATGEGFLATFQRVPTTPFIYNKTNGVSIEFPATGFGGVNYIQVDNQNVIFRELQIKDLNATSGATMIGGSGQIWIDKCIIEGQSQAGGARMVQMGALSIKITNSLVIDHSFGNPTSSTIEAAGTGCTIAYSTFVKTQFESLASVLDANTNSTTASNTVTGCIFVGFDRPFIAVSGQPWVTDHNAYTNATFTSPNATDTGGSIYSATTAALFVNSTSDYHQNSSSPCLNAGVTDTTDIPTADDIFKTSRPQGSAWDIGPHELLAGSTVFRDLAVPITYNRIRHNDTSITAAWGRVHNRDNAVSNEWKAFSLRDIAIWADTKASIPIGGSNLSDFSNDFSVDFGVASGTLTTDCPTPIEWISSVAQPARTVTIPLEWRSSPVNDGVASVDWSSLPVYDRTTPIDWQNNRQFDRSFPVASGLSVSEATSMALESLTARTRDDVVQLQPNGSMATSIQIPIEWTGIAGITTDSNFALEWRSSLIASSSSAMSFQRTFFRNQVAPIEWINSTVALNVTFPIESRSSLISDRTAPIDWRNVVSSTVSAPIAFGVFIANTRTFPTDVLGSISLSITLPYDHHLIIARNAINPIDAGISIKEDTLFPLGISGSSSVGGGVRFPLEINAGVFNGPTFILEIKASPRVDLVGPLAIGRVTLVDYQSGTAWLSAPLAMTIMPLEFGHLTFGVNLSSEVPLEIQATVNADMNSPFYERVGQESIGSALEPDAWEDDNEPTCQ